MKKLARMPDFPKIEKKILRFWQKNKIFKKSVAQNKGGKDFIFYEGPPTANGRPGIHHVLARAFKDVILRYRTMRGEYVPRRAGWDTHGLPVELEAEKELKLRGKEDVENLVKGDKKKSIIKFNQKCKEDVFRYKKEWEELTSRMGFWIEMKSAYITFKDEYIEKVWQVLKKIYRRELIYKDYKIVPYCPRCGTALSSHEVAQGYKNVSEESVYVKFKIKAKKGEYFLVWTTTPWTLPANVALAVGKEISYLKIEVGSEIWILAEALRNKITQKYRIKERLKGKELLGLEYEPLYHFVKYNKKAHFVVPADFVSVKEGTGIVHTAVMYGEEDFELGKRLNLPKKHLINSEGKFIKAAGKLAGLFVKEADKEIITDLEKRGVLYKKELIKHKYPFCWRCHTPLIYYAKESWYIAMSNLRQELLKNNEKINWIPENVKEGRFGRWLEGVKDWAISRERFWGIPLPIWKCEKCKRYLVVGSKAELCKRRINPQKNHTNSQMAGESANKNIELHRPYVDEVELECSCGGRAKRIPEVLDVWFDSGAMPYATGEYDKGRFPADYIVEAVDQTRGWFYTLLAVSTLLGDGPSYKNVICLGHILDAKGKKMSKSLGNIVEPMAVMNQFGADVLRFHFFTINQPGERKRFRKSDLEEIKKRFFFIFWNSALFFQTYAAAENWQDKEKAKQTAEKSRNILDQWLLAKLEESREKVIRRLESFDVYGGAKTLEDLISNLSTWYIRRSRKRFFKNADRIDQKSAFATLYFVLMGILKLIAPFTPFLAEEIYQALRCRRDPLSIHLLSLESKKKLRKNRTILSEMKKTRLIIKKALEERAKVGIKVRQPLAGLTINQKLGKDYLNLIKEEVNLKKVKIGKSFALETKITPELKREGVRREFVRKIQRLRAKKNLLVTDRIVLEIKGKAEDFDRLFDRVKTKKIFMDSINAKEIKFCSELDTESDFRGEIKFNQEKVEFSIR